MTDLVERVARAIGGEENGAPVDEPGERWRNWEPAARAAITAVRATLPDFRDWGSAREMLTRLGEDAGASDETSVKLSALADWIEQFGDTLASGKETP